jgi:hypothetical protein
MTASVLDRPSVRVLPAPAYDPPFDDEYGSSSWAPLPAQPLLDLPTATARRRTAPATTAPATTAALSPAGPSALSAGPPSLATRTGAPASLGARDVAGPSAPTRAAANRFLTTCLEILNG